VAHRSLTIIVSGMVAADPHQGGATWAVLQYVLGLRRLGHNVLLVEPVPTAAGDNGASTLAAGDTASYFRAVTAAFGLAGSSALLSEKSGETVGVSYASLRELAARADVLLNINGLLTDAALTEPIPVRVYLDIDAGFNQLWQSLLGIDRRFEGHTHHATIGQGIGEPWCRVPTCGYEWIKSVQPVVLDEWPAADRIDRDAFTTVGNWRGYGAFEHDGVLYGEKVHSLRQFMTLPTRTRERFELALSIHPDETRDLEALGENGWTLVDPLEATATPDAYRTFVAGSKGEFGVAKLGYVVAPCGWFSDRSCCYLASGRPVVAQETEFSRYVPTGEGLLAFRTEDEALDALERVAGDYSRHARAARRLAEEYFDSDLVLPRLLTAVTA
jgi:hypothetical protein